MLINTMTAEEVDTKINFLREGAFKFTGFLIIEEYFTPKVLETMLSRIFKYEREYSGRE
jgi:hypothetical protein